MQILRNTCGAPPLGGVHADMPGVLHGAGAVGTPKQAACSGNAGGHCPDTWVSWPGKSVGVRAPEPGETPLSAAEVAFGIEHGLFDEPLHQRVIPAADCAPMATRRHDWFAALEVA